MTKKPSLSARLFYWLCIEIESHYLCWLGAGLSCLVVREREARRQPLRGLESTITGLGMSP